MAKVYGWRQTEYGPRVDVSLEHMRTTEDVYWSPRRKNSYVLAEVTDWARKTGRFWTLPDGREAQLLSVNGIGEERWSVKPRDMEYARECETKGWERWEQSDGCEQLGAARHFGLVPPRQS